MTSSFGAARSARSAALVALAAVTLPASSASAHPLGLGALLVVERDPGSFDVSLRLSPDEAGVARPELVPSGGCVAEGPIARGMADGETLTRSVRLRCSADDGGLEIDGLAGSDVRVLATVRRRDGSETRTVIDPDAARLELGARAGAPRTSFVDAVWLGAEHVGRGLDHLLFVLGLLLLCRTPRALVLAITGFTLGHSITLALATLTAIDVPRAPVEMAIALSLVLVALEALRPNDAPQTLSSARPWLVAGGFGLVHGLGFAGALLDLGLSEARLAEALVLFNVGVELGQLAFVALALVVARLATPALGRDRLGSLAAHAIGAAGVYFVLDRAVTRAVELFG